MSKHSPFTKLIIFIFLTSSQIIINNGEKVDVKFCSNTESRKCEIIEINVNPCSEAAKGEACVSRRGGLIQNHFVLRLKFGGNISFQSYSTFPIFDVPFPTQDRNACNYTKCPVKAGEVTTINYNMSILSFYPTGLYNGKWRIWNEKDDECCFTFPTRII